jgi:hypothetical protein
MWFEWQTWSSHNSIKNVVTAESLIRWESEDSASVGKGCAVLDRFWHVYSAKSPRQLLTQMYSTVLRLIIHSIYI